MGFFKNTKAAYYAPEEEEKVIHEKDRMCMARAMIILHTFYDLLRRWQPDSEIADALEVVFQWIDEAVLMSKRSGDGK